MNNLLTWLQGGDLRSDGLSMEVVRFVRDKPELIPELLEGLGVGDELVRGRTADAIEHLAREMPHRLKAHQALLENALVHDRVPMVRWHMAMVLGHMALDWDDPDRACTLLISSLSDESVFVVSWAIVSLCLFSRLFVSMHGRILAEIAPLSSSSSVAIRSKIKQATAILQDQGQPIPKGWVKSEKIKAALMARNVG